MALLKKVVESYAVVSVQRAFGSASGGGTTHYEVRDFTLLTQNWADMLKSTESGQIIEKDNIWEWIKRFFPQPIQGQIVRILTGEEK